MTVTGYNVGVFFVCTNSADDDPLVVHVQGQESLSRKTAEHVRTESPPVEANEPSPVRRLDGEVTRLGDYPFAEGNYCELWVGSWKKAGSRETGKDKEKVKH